MTVTRARSSAPAGVKVADNTARCVCPSGTVDIAGSACLGYEALLPAVLVPALALIAGAALLGVWYRLAQEDALWKIQEKVSPSPNAHLLSRCFLHNRPSQFSQRSSCLFLLQELVFSDTEDVLGVGSHGLVLRADFRGTPVAVKRFAVGPLPTGPSEPVTSCETSEHGARSPSGSPMRASPGAFRKASVKDTLDVSTLRRAWDTERTASSGSAEGATGSADATAMLHTASAFSTATPQATTSTARKLRRDMRALVTMRHPSIAALLGVADVKRGPQRGLCLVSISRSDPRP